MNSERRRHDDGKGGCPRPAASDQGAAAWRSVAALTGRRAVRQFLLFAVLFADLPVSARADASVAVLLSHDGPPYRRTLAGFKSQLAALGVQPVFQEWVVEQRDTLAAALTQLERQPPGLVLSLGTVATQAITGRPRQTPVVATLIFNSGDLRGARNATGVGLDFPVATQWQWFKRLLGGVREFGVLYDPDLGTREVEELKRLAGRDSVALDTAEGATPEALPNALKRLPSTIGALWGLGESRLLSPQTAHEILLYSFRNRIPLVGLSSSWVKAGALYALDRDYDDLGRQCAEIADQILKGKAASGIPLATPRRVLYSLNLKTAEHMKLEFPEEVIRSAAEVYR